MASPCPLLPGQRCGTDRNEASSHQYSGASWNIRTKGSVALLSSTCIKPSDIAFPDMESYAPMPSTDLVR